jgi:hypothetical protein
MGAGASTAGEFSPFTVNVFLADAGTELFAFKNLSNTAEAQTANYTYGVPYNRSHLLIKTGERRTQRTAFEGIFSIDVKTHDLKRLIVDILHPPPESGMQTAQIATDSSRMEVGTATVLLPQTSTAAVTTAQETSR